MRQSPNQKRPRGGRSAGRKGNAHGGNRSFESNGPIAKIRGNASQLYDKYQAMARDAHSAGDRIATENFLQHAEHYYRLLSASSGGQSRGNGQTAPSPPPGTGPQPRIEQGGGERAAARAPGSDDGDSEPKPS